MAGGPVGCTLSRGFLGGFRGVGPGARGGVCAGLLTPHDVHTSGSHETRMIKYRVLLACVWKSNFGALQLE